MQALVDSPGHVDDIQHLLKVSLLVLLLAEVSTDLSQVNVLSAKSRLQFLKGPACFVIELLEPGQLSTLARENIPVCRAQMRVFGLISTA